jgi:hydroxyacylglutathione hydrolase
MILRQITSEGLAHNSYFISAGGQGAVIDPRRDIEVYLNLARASSTVIRYIFETHRNEDYVIGSLELADRTGATILHGHQMDFAYGQNVREGDTFSIGPVELKVLETPGHTLEHIAIVVTDTDVSPRPYAVFTGDALFAGEVGRTDFFGPERRAAVSEMLYESITRKILPLGDQTLVFPAHGAGSVCGSEISDHEVTTIGYERISNPYLQLTKDAFIARKVSEHLYLPPYFRMMERVNKEGAPLVHQIPYMKAWPVSELRNIINAFQVVDIRSPTAFAAGFIPGSLSIWKEGLPAFMGWFLNYTDPVLLVDDFNCDLATIGRHFMRLGYDNLSGYLAGGFPAWFKSAAPVENISAWSVQELNVRRNEQDLYLLDVRDVENVERLGKIPGAHHIYIGELPGRISEVPRGRAIVVYCDAGYKGSIGASILSRTGYQDVVNILGGMTAWIAAGYTVEGNT